MTFSNLSSTIDHFKGISAYDNGNIVGGNNGGIAIDDSMSGPRGQENATFGGSASTSDDGDRRAAGKSNAAVSVSLSLSIIGAVLMLSAWPNSVGGQSNGPLRREMSPYKGYSGVRVRGDSSALVYVHDQTVAVVEVGSDRQLFNCELIEIYKPNQGVELLRNLSASVARPVTVSFEQMMDLMDSCLLLDTPDIVKLDGGHETARPGRGFASTSRSTILSGIIPGTKWCGAGDLAETFYDLGKEENLDRCCRNHDICPSKVRPSTTRYGLTNNAVFTKSHCTCDYKFLQCLKKTKIPTADIMGNFYFNLLRVPCLNITGHRFQSAYRY